MLNIIKRTIRILGINLKEILLFEIFYRMTTGIVLLSLFTRGMTLAIKYSGYSYLTTKNLGRFLTKPFTILVLLAVLCVGLLFLAVETSALLAALQAGERCERLAAHRIFARGLVRCRYYLKAENIYVAIVNVLMLLVFHYVIFLRGISHIKLLSDMVEGIGNSTRWSGFFVLLAVGIVFLFLPGMFTMHFGLLNKKDGREAWRESCRLVFGHTFRTVCSMLCLNIFLYLMFRLVLAVLAFLSALVIYFFVSRTIMLALSLTTYDWLELGMLAAASIANGICNLALLTGMYYTYREEEGMAPELLVPGEDQRRRGNKRTRRTLIAVAAATFSLFLYDVVENGLRFAKNVLVDTAITAHRGSSVEAPENTLPAVQLAIDQMADYVEIDVQLTKDGEIILLHDRNFRRTCGDGGSPWEMTFDEIRKLNAAAYMPDYEWTPVPTLDEVLECCKDKININIELKNNNHDELLPDKVLELVKKYGMEDQCIYTSMSIPFLERVKELDEECKTGFILSTAYGDFSQNEMVDFFSISASLLNERNIAQIHETGREIHAWTVNTKAEAERLKYMNVDNIITDYPVMVREILYREKDTENFLEILQMVLD